MKAPLIHIIDKNPIHRNLVRYHLETGRFAKVAAFPSAEECFYHIRHHECPDFIITTFFNGRPDGFRFMRDVETLAPGCRILFFDLFDDHELPGMLMQAGATDYVAKTREPDAGITELVKNVKYLVRESITAQVL
ncbi:MAG TPA: response regulator [Bacteroidales bacterium]|nr:response regulator [Bacteroidales bacterium]